jgi:LuxR family maltose regulon positive regulatory protein
VPPELPERLVSRPRLLSALDRARDKMTTLVCAPAGSGKTLLLAEWARRSDAADTAWVSLDDDDNEDRRFWSAFLDALAICPSVPAESPIRTLAVPPRPSSNLGFLADAVNALDDLPDTVRLVLDDVHELTDPGPLHGLETLLRHQPAGLRLVLSSRYDPPLPLARLRLVDQLAELRAEELKFSLEEARALLVAAGVDLSPDQQRRLVKQTEGWAAGLRLAAVSLSETDAPDTFLRDFAENDHAMTEYLIDEVMSRLPHETREFLRTISICDQVSAGLAGALSGSPDAGAMLESLNRRPSLAIHVGAKRHWYRVHALVRTHLLADLRRQSPGRARELNGKAADWFAAHGQPARALAHAGQARDVSRVASLLSRQAVTLTLAGEHDMLRRALAVLGDELIAENSQLALVSALLHLEVGEPMIAKLHLVHAEAAWPAHPATELETLRQLVRSSQAQVAGDIDDMMKATENLDAAPMEQPALAALAMLHRGTALLATGQRAAARDHVQAALEVARESGQDYVATQCVTILGVVAGAEGDFRLMNELARKADTENVERGWQHTVHGVMTCLLLAYGALLRAELPECVRQAVRAGQLAEVGEPRVCQGLNLLAGVLHGVAQFQLGERTAGLRRIREARAAAGDGRFSEAQTVLCAVLEHGAALSLGWGDAAREVLSWVQASISERGELLLMRARAQVLLGRHGSARNIVRPLLNGTVEVALSWSTIEAFLVETEVALQAGEDARARRALDRALSLSESMDVLYPLVFAPTEVAELLTRQLGKLGVSERFAGRVLLARRSLSASPVTVSLTERERSVLRLLPTLRSFDEIADDLTVSPNTVKTHVRAIYTKLGVRKRRDAVAVALERGLVETSLPLHSDEARLPPSH